MKFKSLFVAAIIAAFGMGVAVPAANASVPTEICVAASQSSAEIVKYMAEALNDNEVRQMMIQESEGTIDSFSAVPSGNTLVLNIRFASALNFNDLSNSETNELVNALVTEFKSSMGADAIAGMKSMGVSITIKFTDHYGHSISRSI